MSSLLNTGWHHIHTVMKGYVLFMHTVQYVYVNTAVLFRSINIQVLQRALCNLERLVTFRFLPHFLPPSPFSLPFFGSFHLSLLPSVTSFGCTVFILCFFSMPSAFLPLLILFFFCSFCPLACHRLDLCSKDNHRMMNMRPPSVCAPSSLLVKAICSFRDGRYVFLSL